MSSSDRRPYLTATTLDQDLLDNCHDNLECKLEMICEIETPTGTIYASDRNKYVGDTFYEALLVFPVIGRTVGEWLSNELQFATLTLELSNVDGRFSNFLPAGNDYGNWIGKEVLVKVGLAEQASTYTTVFKGYVTSVGGFRRTVKSIVIVARDSLDKINAKFPNTTIAYANYPKCEQKNLGKIIPYIYGDFSTGLDPYPAAVPGYCVNGEDPFVSFKDKPVAISGSTFSCVAHGLDEGDTIEFETTGSLPSPLLTATTYYVRNPNLDNFQISATILGAIITTSGPQSGSHSFKPATGSARANLEIIISENDNTYFNQNGVYVKRGENWNAVPSSELVGPGGSNNYFEIKQGGVWMNDGAGTAIAYEFDTSDEIYVQVKGKDLGSYDDNIVEQAKDILKTFGGLTNADFDGNWSHFRNKSTPAESAINSIKSRVWANEQTPAMTYVLSMLEQVRLEAFIDRNLKLKINSLHFDEFDANPSYTVKNWDIEKNSLKNSIDDRNNFNRAQAAFCFLPVVNENVLQTSIYKNTSAITQTGITISKKIVFPNLYESNSVVLQLKEMLKVASGTIEIIDMVLTWRALLLDIGDFVKLNIDIGSINMENIPSMIREIGYDPNGFKLPVKIWSFQMLPFGSWNPGYNGITGGQSATIDEEI